MDMKVIELKDFPLHCRTCLNKFTGIKHDVNKMSKSLQQLFTQLTGYKKLREDIYPDGICELCYLKLNNVDDFQTMSKQSKEFLDEMIKTLDATLAINNKTDDNLLVLLPTTNELNVEDPLQNKEITIKMELDITTEDKDKMNSPPTTISKQKNDCVDLIPTSTCSICNDTFSTLAMHMCKIQSDPLFVCEKCERGFNSKNDFQMHMEEVHVEKLLEISCKYGCGELFGSSYGAKIHYQSHHKIENSFHHLFDEKSVEGDKINNCFEIISPTTCSICNKNYSSPSALAMHIRNHQPERPFPCEKCDRGFNTKHGLQRHMEIHAEKPLEFICKYGCGKIFDRSHKANVHYKRHHKGKNSTDFSNKKQTNISPYISEDCGEVCNNIENLKQHLTQHPPFVEVKSDKESGILTTTLKETNDSFDLIPITTCSICSKTYSSPSALAMHMRNHQPDRPFPCEKCDRGFNTKHGLQRHMEIHAEKPLEFICKYGCGKIFDRSHKAIFHYKRHHKKENSTDNPNKRRRNSTPYICEECGKVYNNMQNLKQHRIRHLPVEERPYPCKKCNKRFGAAVDLKFHMMRHDGIRNFECPHCGVKKTTAREVRLHVSNVHTKEMQVRCDICSKIFLHLGSLRRHEKVVHQGMKNYKCNYCGQAFAKAQTLRNHEMRHTGKRPYKCHLCEKSFIQSVMLNSHMNKHH